MSLPLSSGEADRPGRRLSGRSLGCVCHRATHRRLVDANRVFQGMVVAAPVSPGGSRAGCFSPLLEQRGSVCSLLVCDPGPHLAQPDTVDDCSSLAGG